MGRIGADNRAGDRRGPIRMRRAHPADSKIADLRGGKAPGHGKRRAGRPHTQKAGGGGLPRPRPGRVTDSAADQPFRPEDATPWTKYFCNARKTIKTGIRAMTEAAMIRPYSAEYWLMNIRRPIWMVFSSFLVR